MIIPKAIFLNYKYRKEQNKSAYTLQQECQKMMGVLVTSLRSPSLHSVGEISHFFSCEQYVQLCQAKHSVALDECLAHFKMAGYEVESTRTEAGIFVYLSWRHSGPQK